MLGNGSLLAKRLTCQSWSSYLPTSTPLIGKGDICDGHGLPILLYIDRKTSHPLSYGQGSSFWPSANLMTNIPF
jgi:hypothetical protein